MNSKNGKRYLICISIVIGALLFSNCDSISNSDEATVTIRLQRNDVFLQPYKEKPFMDRILEFFSTPAYAAPSWDGTHGDLTLIVSSPNLSGDLTFFMPPGATVYTVTIPAVDQVTLTVVSETESLGYKNWGGHTTLNLVPGSKVNLTLAMIPMTASWSPSATSGSISFWLYSIDTLNSYNALSFFIYRSTSPQGPYERIATGINLSTMFYTDTYALVPGTTYYYRISVNSSDGEGVMCDPVSATAVP
jgi:hypothetical protein